MGEDIQKSILDVERAIEDLNQAFQKRAETLSQGGESKELQKWMTATHAMRDSGSIYLSWAKHYARSAGIEIEADDDEAFREFLDEASDLPPGERPTR